MSSFPSPVQPRWWALGALGVAVVAPAGAQTHDHSASAPVVTFHVDGLRVDPASPPPGSALGRAGARFSDGGYVHIVYGRPYARGRLVFGGLVGYGQVWATGAHYATELTTTVALTVGGTALPAGTYSLFTTPRPDRWTVHLNRRLGMHLADDYRAADDVLTVDVTPEVLDPPVEALTLDFVPSGTGVDLRIRWSTTGITVPLRRP